VNCSQANSWSSEIAAQMGAARRPVREALQRLDLDGLVERQAHSATFVAGISTDEMYELFTIRSVIESFAIRRTAQNITPNQCDELQELVEKMTDAGRNDDMLTLAEHDMGFHRRICEWSNSNACWRLGAAIQSDPAVRGTHHRAYFPDLVELAGYQPIVDVLRSGDTQKAAQVVQEHVMLIWSMMKAE
jgi:DNA-binding GntR family transcriptional regulator